MAGELDRRWQRDVDVARHEQRVQRRRMAFDDLGADAARGQLLLEVVVEREAVDELDAADAHRLGVGSGGHVRLCARAAFTSPQTATGSS